VAVVLSASRMIATVQDLYHSEPHLTARILGYWSNAFSAAVALCLLVSRAPFTCMAPAALQELERARILFRSAKDFCPRAMQVVPILETMIDKANDIYDRWSTGHEMPTVVLRQTTTDDECDGGEYGTSQYVAQGDDPFARFHPRLVQCVFELHQRAKSILASRKACQPRSWGPTPVIPSPCSPVLPPEVPQYARISSASSHSQNDLSYNGMSSSSQYGPPDQRIYYSNAVLSSAASSTTPWPPSMLTVLSPTSKMAIVDTINFELGAINSNNDHQSWMAFF